MKQQMVFGWMMAAALLTAGCATSLASRANETNPVEAKLTSVEGQLGAVSQRLEELSQRQAALEAQMSSRTAAYRAQRTQVASLSPKEIQQALKAGGFYSGSIDGKLGPQTKEALKTFQRSQGLSPDGVAGAQTTAKLAKLLPSEP